MARLNGFPALADDSLDLDSVGAVASTYCGLPLTAAGKVAVATEGAVDASKAHNGFQFTAAGRLCVSLANAVATIHNGFGFDSAGRLCVTTGAAPTRHGALYDANRKVKATVV